MERHRDEFYDLIANHVDILFANEQEIHALCQSDDFDTCVERIRGQVDLAVLTRSEKGSVLVTPSETIAVAAQPLAARGGGHNRRG